MIEQGRLRVTVPVSLRVGRLSLRLWAGEQQLSHCVWTPVPAGWIPIIIEAEFVEPESYARVRLSVGVQVKRNEAVSISVPEKHFLQVMLKTFTFLPLDVVAQKDGI